jgi:hypothetical protein
MSSDSYLKIMPEAPLKYHVYFLVSWDGVRISPLGASAIIWPILTARILMTCHLFFFM